MCSYRVTNPAERSIYPSAELRQTAEWVASGPEGLEYLVEGRVGLAGSRQSFGIMFNPLDPWLVPAAEVPPGWPRKRTPCCPRKCSAGRQGVRLSEPKISV